MPGRRLRGNDGVSEADEEAVEAARKAGCELATRSPGMQPQQPQQPAQGFGMQPQQQMPQQGFGMQPQQAQAPQGFGMQPQGGMMMQQPHNSFTPPGAPPGGRWLEVKYVGIITCLISRLFVDGIY